VLQIAASVVGNVCAEALVLKPHLSLGFGSADGRSQRGYSPTAWQADAGAMLYPLRVNIGSELRGLPAGLSS
jgi:hypothetical protein